MSPALTCPACQAQLLGEVFNQPDFAACPACRAPVRIEAFPALFRKINPGKSAETVMVEGESSCFFHPQKKATLPCDGCGRFLCALCDCELNGQHFCPTCLDAGKTKGKIASLDHQRTRYDSVALALAIYPLIVFYITLVTAPVALFIAIRHWNTPCSLVKWTRYRLVLAIIIALLELAGWTLLFVRLASRH